MSYPILAANSTWFSQGGTTISKASITQIDIKNTYTPTGTITSSWDASAAKDGSITVYVEGTKLTLAGNGSGKIYANPDSSNMFNGFGKLTIVNGGNILDTSKATTFVKMFQACFELTYVDTSTWNTSNVTSMHTMFQGATSIGNLDVSGWDTKNVTTFQAFLNMPDPYKNTNLTTLNTTNWDTSKATSFKKMFSNCRELVNVDTTNWDTSLVTDMEAMFNDCLKLTSIGNTTNWNTNSVTNMRSLFCNCYLLEDLDVSNWNTVKITNMSYAFCNCASLKNLDVSNWATGVVTDMNNMFSGCFAMETLDVSNWDVSKVTSFHNMFAGANFGNPATKFKNLDVSKWDTSSATTMSFMFYGYRGAKSVDVSNWDVSKVTTFDHMFAHSRMVVDTSKWIVSSSCTNLNGLFHSVQNRIIDVSNFNTSNVMSFDQLFDGCAQLIEIIGLENFDTSAGLGFADMFRGCSKLRTLNLSSFDTTHAKDGVTTSENDTLTTTMKNMFTDTPALEKIVLGEKFSFNGDGTTTLPENIAILPTPSSEYMTDADGNWYSLSGAVYTPSTIPSMTADTYYVSPKARGEYLVQGTTLFDLGTSIRSSGDMNSTLTPAEMIANVKEVYEKGNADAYVEIDDEVTEQADLIAQIKDIVDNLPEAGEGGGGDNNINPLNMIDTLLCAGGGTTVESGFDDYDGAFTIPTNTLVMNESFTKSLLMPDNVFVGNPFGECLGLVVVPSCITQINESAFEDVVESFNEAARAVFLPANPPSMGWQGMWSMDGGCYPPMAIYVPDNSVEAYKAHPDYAEYVNLITPLSEFDYSIMGF